MATPPTARPPGASPGSETMNIVAGVGVTLLLHGTIVGLMALATMHSTEAIEEFIEPKIIEFEDVDLVALGEEKPPEALPRIANPAPKKAQPKKAVNLAKRDDSTPEKEKEEPKDAPEKDTPETPPETNSEDNTDSNDDLLDELDDLHDPNRPTNTDAPEGVADGAVGGLSSAAVENLMGTYVYKLKKEISRVWTVPATVPREEIASLQGAVSVQVFLSKDGYVRDYKFLKKSSNEQFNLSIERVLRRFHYQHGRRKLPLPDKAEIRTIVMNNPLNLNTWEYTGQ